MEDLSLWLDLVGNLGVIGLLAIAIYLGLTGRVVPADLLESVIAKVVEDVLDEMERRGKL